MHSLANGFWVVLSHSLPQIGPASSSQFLYAHDVANKSIGRLGVFSFLTHTIGQRSNAGICDKLHFIAQLKSCLLCFANNYFVSLSYFTRDKGEDDKGARFRIVFAFESRRERAKELYAANNKSPDGADD